MKPQRAIKPSPPLRGTRLELWPRIGDRARAAFTLIELLTVIAIIGILAAITAPVLMSFRKGDAMLAASRTMLDGVGYARQLAISQHTTVYMIFAPPEFWNDSLYLNLAPFNRIRSASPADFVNTELTKATNILEKQLTGFTFVSLRSIGDQPGNPMPRYLFEWRTLPDKAFIADWKFRMPVTSYLRITDSSSGKFYDVHGFNITNTIPFPSEDVAFNASTSYQPTRPYIWLPYIAFDYQGRLVTADGTPLGRDEYIPLAHGSVAPATDGSKRPIMAAPSIQEQPAGNSTNTSYALIHIDWVTGRARLEQQHVK